MKRGSSLWLAVVASVAVSCGEPQEAEVVIVVRYGDLDPFEIPNSIDRVELLALEIITDAGSEEIGFELSQGPSFDRELDIAPSSNTELILRGSDPADGRLHCAGRSSPFEVIAGETVAPSIFLGRVDTFTPVGTAVAPRIEPAVARLGEDDVLITSGYEIGNAGQVQLATPAVERYRHGELSVCSTAQGCVSGDPVPPRRAGVAVTLSDGAVLHGLGLLAGDVGDNTLFRTDIDGVTVELDASGDPLPAQLSSTTAVLRGDTVFLIGGDDGTGSIATVFELTVSATDVSVATSDVTLNVPRARAAAITDGDDILVIGGTGTVGAVPTGEILGGPLFDGGIGRATLLGARIGAAVVGLPDGGILIAGGGTAEFEILSRELGTSGGFIDVDTPIATSGAAAARAGNAVLLAGGEDNGASPFAAFLVPAVENDLSLADAYQAQLRLIDPSQSLRAGASLIGLPDQTVLAVGGGTEGITAGQNPGMRRLEVIVGPQ